MFSPFRPSQRAELATGQPISHLMAQALASPELISLAAGFVDQQTLPVGATQKAFLELFSDIPAAQDSLQYGTTLGEPRLRAMLLERTLDDDELAPRARPTSEQVVVTSGSNQLLHLTAESLLDPGDIVLCASPTYLVFLGTLANLGARSVGIDSDELGMVPEASLPPAP